MVLYLEDEVVVRESLVRNVEMGGEALVVGARLLHILLINDGH